MINIVLFEPEIPTNTGNIGRTCVVTGARLHLIEPLGFSLDDEMLRRAGMNYWQSLDVVRYESWEDFLARNPGVETRLHLVTKHTERLYTDVRFEDGDFLVFGRESSGLPRELHERYADRCARIPMLDDAEALEDALEWHTRNLAYRKAAEAHEDPAPTQRRRDVCGNFVDDGETRISSLNLSNAVAIVLYEAVRQIGGLH